MTSAFLKQFSIFRIFVDVSKKNKKLDFFLISFRDKIIMLKYKIFCVNIKLLLLIDDINFCLFS